MSYASARLVGFADDLVVIEILSTFRPAYELRIPVRRGEAAMVDGNPVWGWDGQVEKPTLNPSIQSDRRADGRLHIFIVKGEMIACSDNQITLLASPRAPND